MSPEALRNWAIQFDVDQGKAEGLTTGEREELRRLRRENRILVEEREILKKSGGLLRPGRRDPVSVYRFVAAEKALFQANADYLKQLFNHCWRQ